MNKDIIRVPSAIPVSMFLSKFGLKLQQERLRTEREREPTRSGLPVIRAGL